MNLIKELQEKKGFSDSERTIADYLLKHSRLLPSMTTRQLAQKTYTSSAAIVRFCQKSALAATRSSASSSSRR